MDCQVDSVESRYSRKALFLLKDNSLANIKYIYLSLKTILSGLCRICHFAL